MVAWALGLAVEGCAANQGPELPSGPDAGGDEGSFGDGAAPNQGVRLVVVNGLTRAAAVSDAGKPVRDARLCLEKQGLALPSEGTMPLASYPGVARGRGVDLGQVLSAPLAGKVRIDVFDADAVRLSASSSSGDCTKLTDPQAGFAYVPSATLASEIVAGAAGPTLPTPTALTSVAPPPSRSSATVTEASAASHDVKTPNCPRMGLGPASGTLAALVPASTACSMATPPAGSSRSTSRLTPDTRVTESVAEGT